MARIELAEGDVMKSEKAWILAAAAAVAVLAIAGMVAGPSMVGGGSSAVSVADDAMTLAAAPEVIVYKSPTCGCCVKWVEHMSAAGFSVRTVDVEDEELVAIKQRNGITRELSSCHTALVGDYVIEGHVPAELVVRLLNDAPEVRGLAVPGMPIGSPGMEIPGRAAQEYEVVAFDDRGGTEVYAER